MEPQNTNGAAPEPPKPNQPIGMPPLANVPEPPAQSHSKFKLLWIILGVVGAVIVLFIAFAIYSVGFSPAGRSVRASNSFMKAVTAGDSAAALTYAADATNSSTKAFIEQAAKNSGTSFKLAQHTHKESTYYYLYTLSGGSSKYGRTVVSQVDGAWKVTGYVYSANSLSLIPPESSVTTNSSTPTQSTTTATCLVASDFDALFKEMNGQTRPASIDYTKSTTYYTNNVHFNPDTLNYDIPAQADGVITAISNFVKTNVTKKFAINVQGSVATTDTASLDFANQRAEKVKQGLIAKGVAGDRIILDKPVNVATYGGDNSAVAKQTARNVVVVINDPCTGAAVAAGHTAMTTTTGR